jgi:type VI secretion system protein ImpJ
MGGIGTARHIVKKRRVVWSNGMFLTPQHFQLQDEYFEDNLRFLMRASTFANWGLSGISIDESSLASGFFRIRHCEGVLPDGLIFNMPEADEIPPGRALDDLFSPHRQTLDIFLAIPEVKPSGQNFSLTENGSLTRFTAEVALAPDATDVSEERPIQLARKTFRLLLEGERLDGLTTMRIAQISRNAKGEYTLSPKFVPPVLDITASDYLMMLARRQIEVLTAKSSSLAAPRRAKGRDLADFSSSEIANFWLLHTVNSFLPELKHIWKVRRGHPDVLFRAMLRLAGALSTFALEGHAFDMPDYDHDDVGPCFTDLDLRIRDLLETVLPSKCLAIPLTLSDKLIWSGLIPDERYLSGSQAFLSVSAHMAVEDVIAKFPRLVKVSSPSEIERLVRKSLPGIGLRHSPAPPASIPIRLDCQYFSLGQAGALWDSVTQSRSLSVFAPGEIVDPKMELLLVQP